MFKSSLIILFCIFPWTNTITHDEVEVFIEALIYKDIAKYYTIEDLEGIRSLLFGMINTCPTLTLHVIVHEWLNLDECTSDFQTYMTDLAFEPSIYANMDNVRTQISASSYCLVNSITKVVEECFISDNSTDYKKELKSIRSFSLDLMVILKYLLTNWVTIASKDDLYLLEILRSVKVMRSADVMAFQTCAFRLAKWRALGHDILLQEEDLGTFSQCLLAGLEDSDDGFCGFFEPDSIADFKECLGYDYEFCNSRGYTDLFSIILGHKEFLQSLNKIFCGNSEYNMKPNVFHDWSKKEASHDEL